MPFLLEDLCTQYTWTHVVYNYVPISSYVTVTFPDRTLAMITYHYCCMGPHLHIPGHRLGNEQPCLSTFICPDAMSAGSFIYAGMCLGNAFQTVCVTLFVCQKNLRIIIITSNNQRFKFKISISYRYKNLHCSAVLLSWNSYYWFGYSVCMNVNRCCVLPVTSMLQRSSCLSTQPCLQAMLVTRNWVTLTNNIHDTWNLEKNWRYNLATLTGRC